MDSEVYKQFLLAIVKYNIPATISKRVKSNFIVTFNSEFFDSEENLRILRELEIPPLSLILKNRLDSSKTKKDHCLISLNSINKEYLKYSYNELKKSSIALNHAVSDLVHHWSRIKSEHIKNHRSISDEMYDNYLKVRKKLHPDFDREFTHEDLIKAVNNFQIYVKVKEKEPDLFLPHQWKNLHVFLRSKSAIEGYFLDKNQLKGALSNSKYRDEVEGEKTPEDVEEDRLRDIRFFKMIKESVDMGRQPEGDFLEFWESHQYLLGEIDD